MNFFQKKIAELKAVITETKFAEAKLIDGTIVRSEGETFEPKQKLEAITEDGSVVTAPEGMHETTEGEILVVNGEGIITEVRKAEPEVETEMETEDKKEEIKEEEMADVSSEEVVDEKVEEVIEEIADVVAEKIAELEKRINGLEMKLSEIEAESKSKDEKVAEVAKENEMLKAKLEEPIVTPSNHKKVESIFGKKEAKVESSMLSKIRDLKK